MAKRNLKSYLLVSLLVGCITCAYSYADDTLAGSTALQENFPKIINCGGPGCYTPGKAVYLKGPKGDR